MVSCHDILHISTRVFVQLLVVPEYDDCHIDRAKDGKLMRLLEQTTFALEERAAEGNISRACDGEVVNVH